MSTTTAETPKHLVYPEDEHNRLLVSNVHPPEWKNPTPSGRYNMVVIGGGTAGLISAAGAAGLGAKVALVERHLLGGDCLNYGCVPSKGVIRAARAAYEAGELKQFGMHINGSVSVNFSGAMERMRRLRASISRHDSAKRFTSLGVDVFIGNATFVSPDTVEVDGQRLNFSRAVIATGARAAEPQIPGLKEAGYLTNESIFSLTELPEHLIVIGAGPIGCELAQSFRRFGSRVTIFDMAPHILPREDAAAAAIVQAQFDAEGITRVENCKIIRVESNSSGKSLALACDGGEDRITGSHILVAAGRAPNVDDMGLEAAGVEYTKRGVKVDDNMRTTNPHIFAAGDVCSRFQFTHAADAMARIVIQNALFFGRKKASDLLIPWATFTDPEIAHVGLYEHDAKKEGRDVVSYKVDFSDMDRAVLDGETNGFAKVVADKKTGRILGATIVASHAGEMIGEMVLAIRKKLSLADIAQTIHPYPTQAEALKRAGDMYMRTKLTPRVKAIMQWFLGLRR